MKCKNCGEDMIITDRWGDGYYEPREINYECPHCYANCNCNEAYGEEWTGLDDDEYSEKV